MITELTTALKQDIGARPDPAQFTDVSRAIADVETSAGHFTRQCDDPSGTELECMQAFDVMMAAWRRLYAAAGWGAR